MAFGGLYKKKEKAEHRKLLLVGNNLRVIGQERVSFQGLGEGLVQKVPGSKAGQPHFIGGDKELYMGQALLVSHGCC